MPATGKDLAVGDIAVVENNVHGGVKYMRYMMDRYFKDEPMTPLDKGLFTFAAYNAGPARIAQLRKEAAKRGLDPNRWFNHVELVAADKIGPETVTYVANIYKYYTLTGCWTPRKPSATGHVRRCRRASRPDVGSMLPAAGRAPRPRYNLRFSYKQVRAHEASLIMELAKSFEPHAIEAKWYPFWESHGLFRPSMQPGAAPYCIQLPPPNVTGTLHMGHAFQQTLMDLLVRYHRMRGDNTLWQVGTDHAGIATQIVVEQQLRMEGKSRRDLGRAQFVERVWAWKEESGSAITQQMRRLGASADWSRERFTMDEGLSAAVLETFVRLFDDGLIYRGKRLVSWDPKLGTAVSDLEVESEEEQGKIWQIRYPLTDGSASIVVATTRPETMLGDVAVAVNPDDDRYRALVGKTVTLPLTGRMIPIVADDYVDRGFGTGAVKITPAHDFNDWQVGQRHGLVPITIFTLTATVNDNAPEKYRGLDRYAARKAVVADLTAAGLLVSEKAHTMVVPRCGRTGEIIEPMLTDQWFVDMRKKAPATHAYFPGQSIQDLCLAAVSADGLPAGAPGTGENVRFVPPEWISTYYNWINNIQDWCISRQLWWGHQIPAWYDDAGNTYVARSEADARAQAVARLGREPRSLVRDEDVLDTWFSSALWCHSTLGWPEETPELKTFLPSSTLITGSTSSSSGSRA